MDDQNVMAVDPEPSPRSITREGSSDRCGPRRDSIEDADPSLTRKRQRLNNSTDCSRSGSADRPIFSPAQTEPEHTQQTSQSRNHQTGVDRRSSSATLDGSPSATLEGSPSPTSLIIRSPKANMRVDHPPLSRTSSKVTINVRGPRPEMINGVLHGSPVTDAERAGSSDEAESDAVVEPVKLDSTDTVVIDTSSAVSPSTTSSVRSPEVEIAEVEDMEHDYGPPGWGSVVSVLEPEGDDLFMQSFPFYHKDCAMRDIVNHIARNMEKGPTNLDTVSDIANWLELCVSRSEQQSLDWYEIFSARHEFWSAIPNIIECLLKRHLPFHDQFLRRPTTAAFQKDREALERLFANYGRLTLHLLMADIQTLETTADPSEEPELICPRYLVIFSWTMALPVAHEVPLMRLLHEHYSYDVEAMAAVVVSRFSTGSPNGLDGLLRYAQLLQARLPQCNELAKLVWHPFWIIQKLIAVAVERTSEASEGDGAESNLWGQIIRGGATYCRIIDKQLRADIEKQTALPRDHIKDISGSISSLLVDLAHADENLGRALFEESGGDPSRFESDDMPQLVARAWKFGLLLKCIMKGRMELRVQALDIMTADLVDAFKHYGVSGTHHPVMQCLADFVLGSKLVEYLVGVDSHLQLIDRSANVAGFLVVTDKYSSTDSDAIWHMVSTNPDPRTVGAILRMLKGIFNVLHYPDLLYLCQKLNEMPLPSFDAAIIDYAGCLLNATQEKFRTLQQPSLDMPPYEMCIRLVREATASRHDPIPVLSPVLLFAQRELHHLLSWGPSIEHRKRIYRECIEDIRTKSVHCTGSICVITLLLQQRVGPKNVADALETLTAEFDLTRLVIQEATHSLRFQPDKDSAYRDDTALTFRLDLLGRIIANAPSTITSELGEELWRCIAENDTLDARQRDLGWKMFCNVTGRVYSRNSFIDQCIQVHLPHLDPKYFTIGVLNMAQQVIQYEQRMAAQRSIAEHEIIEVTGSDLIWRIILTAPHQTIEIPAIRGLVDLYLDTVIRNAPRSAVEATHLALVDRCVRQLTTAASKLKAFTDGTTSGEDEPMVIVAHDAEVKAEEMCFSRSLMLLRQLLRGMRERPQYSPRASKAPEGSHKSESVNGDKGELIRVRYRRSSQVSMQPAIKELEIGELETWSELGRRLCSATGFPRVRALLAGRELDLEANSSNAVRDLRVGSQYLVVARKKDRIVQSDGSVAGESLTAIEVELLKHFDDLYDLLGLEEKLAAEIWEFLNAFPPQERIRELVRSETVATTEVFPVGQPFKVMYSVAAMRAVLEDQLQKGLLEQSFIARCVRHLIDALTNQALSDSVVNDHLRLKMCSELVSCFLRFLKGLDECLNGPHYANAVLEPVDAEVADTYLADEPRLIDYLMSFCEKAKSSRTWTSEDSTVLACDTFSSILQASLHSRRFWTEFTSRKEAPKLIRRLVLEDMRSRLRCCTSEAISGFCKTTITSNGGTSAGEFALWFWRVLSAILPLMENTEKQPQSAEFFAVTLSIFQIVGEVSVDVLDLNAYVHDWGRLLLGHRHEEIVGRDSVDYFVDGFARLLRHAIRLVRSLGRPLNAGNLGPKIFSNFLFPELSSESTTGAITESIPVLHSPTRKELIELVLSLCKDRATYRKSMELLSDLVPQPYAYNLCWNFQRSKSIRSPTGYVGLHNLSNTCYLNSLFTQLFMNVGFRGFMLNANVPDAEGSQRLLSETQKLFAHMQNSWEMAVEPRELAASIRTYDNENIDVTVQMDVDEFYNLLFDRWEGQILSDSDKKKFRSFYGGQLVQQVKSRECPHVSEREEPFAAIQCDIKGKSTLQDSLKAYVEGDMMEGDNKYSCTSCNRHVDAVKRTCLKEVPDNLIFHLKRFDFDLRTMQRSKINDQFEFPGNIDMRPYKVDHLSYPDIETPEDWFELVGVLVHSGTAESGHYYSFVRERPITSMSQAPDWVQYNDADVQSWDPSNLATQCFGGMESWAQTRDSQPMLLPKAYSAYMLFYQRSSSLKQEQMDVQQHQGLNMTGPKKEPVPLELANYIAFENELFIRKYCLYDEHHAYFVKKIFGMLSDHGQGSCSIDHVLERTAVAMALSHLDQVLARTKDVPDFDDMAVSIKRRVDSCPLCSKLILDWIVGHPETLKTLLFKSPTPIVRKGICDIIMHALRSLREKRPFLYGLAGTSDQINGAERQPGHWTEKSSSFSDILAHLNSFWDLMEVHLRAWDEYFYLLAAMSTLGSPEAVMILRYGFLRRCFELLVADSEPRLKMEYDRFVRLLAKGRKPCYEGLIELVQALMKRINLENESLADNEEDRYENDDLQEYPLTKAENTLLKLHFTGEKVYLALHKMIEANKNPAGIANLLIHIARAEPKLGMLPCLGETLYGGIAIDPAHLASPFLHAMLIMLQHGPPSTDMINVVARTARELDTIGSNGGREHLSFFMAVAQVENKRWSQHPYYFRMKVLEYAESWAPTLLLYGDRNVRDDTDTLLNNLLFDYGFPPNSGDPLLDEAMARTGRELGQACLAKLDQRYAKASLQVDRRLVEVICQVIGKCRDYFGEQEADFEAQRDIVMKNLRDLVTEEGDEAVSDEWDNDSNLATDSSDADATLQVDGTSP